jgi:hypothetical protein
VRFSSSVSDPDVECALLLSSCCQRLFVVRLNWRLSVGLKMSVADSGRCCRIVRRTNASVQVPSSPLIVKRGEMTRHETTDFPFLYRLRCFPLCLKFTACYCASVLVRSLLCVRVRVRGCPSLFSSGWAPHCHSVWLPSKLNNIPSDATRARPSTTADRYDAARRRTRAREAWGGGGRRGAKEEANGTRRRRRAGRPVNAAANQKSTCLRIWRADEGLRR